MKAISLVFLVLALVGIAGFLYTYLRKPQAEQGNDAASLYRMGQELHRKGEYEQAIGRYKKALELKPEFPEALCNLSACLSKTGQLDEAVEAAHEALKLRPKYPLALTNLGVAWARRGNLDEAIIEFRRALELQPDFILALDNLGSALAEKGQSDEAIHLFHQALQLKPDSASTLNNLGVALSDKGQHDEAIVYLEKALRLEPESPGILDSFGLILCRKGRIGEGIKYFRKALKIDPQYVAAHQHLEQFSNVGDGGNPYMKYAKLVAILLAGAILGLYFGPYFVPFLPGPSVSAAIRVNHRPKTCDIYDVDVRVGRGATLDLLYFTVQFPAEVKDYTFSATKYEFPGMEMTEPIAIHENDQGCQFVLRGSALPPNVEAGMSSNPAIKVVVLARSFQDILQGSFMLPKIESRRSAKVFASGYYHYFKLNQRITKQLRFKM
jgi:tetratricopeptide (TPR) repeat protein